MALPKTTPDIMAVAAQARQALSPDGVARITAFTLSARDPDGLFRDRAGRPDRYYTAFGLCALAALDDPITDSGPLRATLDQVAGAATGVSFMDCVSAIRCRRCLNRWGDIQPDDAFGYQAALAGLARYRSADGGYSHEGEGAVQGTVYGAYLVDQAFRDAGQPWPNAAAAITAIETLRTADGGYTNHAGPFAGSAPATAAAAVLLARYGQPDRARAACGFLAALRHPDGGYQATPAAPGPDLLSTATALYAESCCRPLSANPPLPAMAAFVERLWNPDGGFRGHDQDPVSDVEYTFYGLLALGALAVLHEVE